MTENANTPSWTIDGKTLPLFPFDKPQVITLQNGTSHHFKLWQEVIEKRREDLLKTVVLTSPAIVHGENPRDVKTDFSRSLLYYYGAMVSGISGVEYNGNSPEDIIDAQQEVEIDGKKVKLYELVSASVRKAAAARLYSGKIEVERVKDEEDFDDDPFADADSIQAQVDKKEKQKEIYRLTLDRTITIRQEFGIEQLANGQTTEPTHIVRYIFREPTGDEFSKWELKGYRGYSIPLNKGGDRSERFYNLETVKQLFDSLIERIEGASLHGQEIILPAPTDSRRQSLLDMVPLSIKKNTVATLFAEVSSVGNA